MKLLITDTALKLYKTELSPANDDKLRLFVRIGGIGSGGYSVGVMFDEPTHTSYIYRKNGLIFFVNEDDFWYFDGMTIDYDEDLGYVNFINPTFNELAHPN